MQNQATEEDRLEDVIFHITKTQPKKRYFQF
jgi:hypothetical protein